MIELIPAIDLIDGKCVRLTKGDYATQKTYNEDPVAVAREIESYGFKRLHVVDLDGARSKHIVNHKVLERLASSTGLTIDFGGGIKADEDLRMFGVTSLTGYVVGYMSSFPALLFFELVIATIGTIATCTWTGLGVLIQKFYLRHFRVINIILALTLLECIWGMLR